MRKLVVLKLDGEFEQGFRVTLEIGSEDSRPEMEITGTLPPATELVAHYSDWQSTYRSFGITYRAIKVKKVRVNASLQTRKEECRNSADELCLRLNEWLQLESFRPIREKYLKKLHQSDEVRVIICTKSRQLQKLPWHRWDLLEDYPQAEMALSPSEWEAPTIVKTSTKQNQVRILAILGNSEGIDVEEDRQLLENLPDAATTFLVEPSYEELNDQLWEQPWDILFFAGHSETENQTGRIYINQTDSISISELKYGLKKAIAQGLQLAIFNSCDGLGLACELEQLNIPQMIVMREPVPDQVAQKFLKHFLETFANGASLYLAQRQAREHLEGIQDQFPCATWLPVICQNPAVVPPSWLSLQGRTAELERARDAGTRRHGDAEKRELGELGSRGRGNGAESISIPQIPLSLKPPLSLLISRYPIIKHLEGKGFAQVFWVSIAVTFLMMGLRHTRILEPLELEAYDHLMKQRPPELLDERILVVEVTEDDIAEHQYPLEDAIVAQLLNKLENLEPRVLGLDMHRHQPRGIGRGDLISSFANNQNFFTVCASGSLDPNYAPPPEFLDQQRINQMGFSDLIVDSFQEKDRNVRGDLVASQQPENESSTVRRQLLSYDPSLSPSPSSCLTPYSLSFQLAYRFLYKEGVQPLEVTSNEEWEFGSVVFKKLAARFGGYQSLDGLSSQIMINYRSNQPGQRVTLKQVLSGQVDSSWVKDRIVLIGYTAPIARDYFDTPYGKMPGVWIHSHMVSQMLSSVMDKRPLLWVLPQWGEFQWGDTLWVLAWSITGGLLAWAFRSSSLVYLIIAAGTATFLLYQICLFMLTQGGWMPLIPSALALFSTSSTLVIIKD